MFRTLTLCAIATAILAATVAFGSWCPRVACADDEAAEPAEGQEAYTTEASCDEAGLCRPWEYGNPALFYNFYVPNQCGGVPGQLYIAPRPVPPMVGHTYYTYQPLMPHEFMYPHHRTYRKWYDDGRGMTRTRVLWYRSPVTTAFTTLREAVRLPR